MTLASCILFYRHAYIPDRQEVTRHGPSAMASLDRPAGIGGSHVRVSSASRSRLVVAALPS